MRILVFISVVFLSLQTWSAAKIDPALEAFIKANDSRKKVRVVVLMTPAQESAPPKKYDSKSVHRYLMARTQSSLDSVVRNMNLNSNFDSKTLRILSAHWVNNSFVAETNLQGLKSLVMIAGVSKVYNNGVISNYKTWKARSSERRDRSKIPYDLTAMNLDKVWAQRPEITGKGVSVGHIDTGVDGTHPALNGKIQLYYSPTTKQLTNPVDTGSHGTHTAGTILGSGKDGVPMGVAPDAKLIATGALDSYDDMLSGMEFMLDPDKNPETKDFPRVVSNSWNCQNAPDMELFYRAIESWEAFGITAVFSAGNNGPAANSITKPHEHPLVIATAASGIDGKIADFSSRGPATFNGTTVQKPDVTAPGMDIYSSLPGGEYGEMSGTSMAAPHVAGLVALMLQVNPSLNPKQIKEILLKSSRPMNESGVTMTVPAWNATFGLGQVDAQQALSAATFVRSIENVQRGIASFMRLFPFINSEVFTQEETFDASSKYFVTDNSKWIDGASIQ